MLTRGLHTLTPNTCCCFLCCHLLSLCTQDRSHDDLHGNMPSAALKLSVPSRDCCFRFKPGFGIP